jgi:tRNA-specific 2-thiouridylase
MKTSNTVAVGLSGGVDSSLAAALLVESGYTVIGLTMKIWRGAYKIQEGLKHACYGPGEEEDIDACQKLADTLGIEYRVIDLSEEYEKRVIDYFKAEYLAGRTPNPCIICNRELKFGFLADKAKSLGLKFDYFATGHYARKERRNDITFLKRARDEAKDQSYFLYGLDSGKLEEVLFPLGEMTKEEVRSLARQHGLEMAEKPESQDFIAGGDYAPLFEGQEPATGDIVDTEGRIIGKHRGLPYYTIGQRRGLGVSIGPEALYVLSLDPAKNRVIVGPNKGLFSDGLVSAHFRFQDPSMAKIRLEGFAKIRQNHKPVPCIIQDRSDNSDSGVIIDFDIPQRAVAPGQSVVLYSDDGIVLGGGIIDKAL